MENREVSTDAAQEQLMRAHEALNRLDFVEAERLFRQASETLESVLGLLVAVQLQGKDEDAADLAERTARLLVKKANTPAMAADRIAEVRQLLDVGHCAEARMLLMQNFPGIHSALNLVEAIAGAAESLCVQGDLQQSEEYYRLAIVFCDKCFPQAYPMGVYCLRKLAELLSRQGKLEQVDVLLRDCEGLVNRSIQRLKDSSPD